MNLNLLEVDEQHQHLISMLEGVKYAIEEHVPPTELSQLASELQYSFIAHFSAEERDYTSHYHEDNEAQLRDHQELLDNISALKKSLASCSWQMALDLLDAIKYSFLSHVTEFDDRFAPDPEF